MCKVLLSNLPKGLNKAELLHTLSQLGEVVEVHITGEAPGQVGGNRQLVCCTHHGIVWDMGQP